MNIIVCDDTRLFGQPLNQYLSELLSNRGHDVELFDGREQDVPILDCLRCAAALRERVASLEASGMVMDLAWWGDFDFGIDMLKDLARWGVTDHMKVVVWSRFTHEFRDTLRNRLGIPTEQILDKLTANSNYVADMFEA